MENSLKKGHTYDTNSSGAYEKYNYSRIRGKDEIVNYLETDSITPTSDALTNFKFPKNGKNLKMFKPFYEKNDFELKLNRSRDALQKLESYQTKPVVFKLRDKERNQVYLRNTENSKVVSQNNFSTSYVKKNHARLLKNS